jgi:hypothetical protein
MNIETIKQELALKVNQLMKKRKETRQAALKSVHKIKSWPEKVAETQDLIYKVHHTLNELLIEHGIFFNNDHEKEGFECYIEPTVNELIIRHIED